MGHKSNDAYSVITMVAEGGKKEEKKGIRRGRTGTKLT